METTDYCSYELSKALKVAGFDEPCQTFYDVNRELGRALDPDNFNHLGETYQGEWFTGTISAPTLAHAQKWLREKKGIVVIAEPDWDSEYYCMADYLTGEWYFSVWKDGDRVHCNFDPNAEEERIWMFDKYEQALSAGIAAALELIKEGE